MILIVGNTIAKDEMRKNLVKLAAPKNITTKILDNSEAIAFLNSDEANTFKVELLVENTEDALALVKGIPSLRKLNAGLMKTVPVKKMISKYLAVSAQDIENFKEMLELGVEIGCYTVPTEKAVDIRKYIE